MTSLVNIIDETIIFNEETIRIVGTFENPLFVAIDICKILGLKNVTDTDDPVYHTYMRQLSKQ